MSEQEAEEALGKWEKDWKRARDRDRRKNAREEVDDTITYTGVSFELLQTMTEVNATPLNVGDTFPTARHSSECLTTGNMEFPRRTITSH